MIASLPMYDMPSTRHANGLWWREIRNSLGRGPLHLLRDDAPDTHWTASDLLLSQTCGLPYRQRLHDVVQLVGTPDYNVAGCPPGYYRSHLVIAHGDKREDLSQFTKAIVARNSVMSQSGWVALQAAMRSAALTFQGQVLDTGSHRASLIAVATGKAELAAIDAVTWSLLERDTTLTQGLRILQSTPPTPGLPLITNLNEDRDILFAAVDAAIQEIPSQDRACLMLKGIVTIPREDYLNVSPITSARTL